MLCQVAAFTSQKLPLTRRVSMMEFGLFFFIQPSSVILSLSDWIVCISTVLIGVCISTIVCPLLDNFIHWIGWRIVGSDWSSHDRLLSSFLISPPPPCFLTLCFSPCCTNGVEARGQDYGPSCFHAGPCCPPLPVSSSMTIGRETEWR